MRLAVKFHEGNAPGDVPNGWPSEAYELTETSKLKPGFTEMTQEAYDIYRKEKKPEYDAWLSTVQKEKANKNYKLFRKNEFLQKDCDLLNSLCDMAKELKNDGVSIGQKMEDMLVWREEVRQKFPEV